MFALTSHNSHSYHAFNIEARATSFARRTNSPRTRRSTTKPEILAQTTNIKCLARPGNITCKHAERVYQAEGISDSIKALETEKSVVEYQSFVEPECHRTAPKERWLGRTHQTNTVAPTTCRPNTHMDHTTTTRYRYPNRSPKIIQSRDFHFL
jgi:hypothetical protein